MHLCMALRHPKSFRRRLGGSRTNPNTVKSRSGRHTLAQTAGGNQNDGPAQTPTGRPLREISQAVIRAAAGRALFPKRLAKTSTTVFASNLDDEQDQAANSCYSSSSYFGGRTKVTSIAAVSALFSPVTL